jgi:outer membrane protein TolC
MEERFRQALSEWVPQETLQSAISCEGPRPENEAAGPLVDHPDARALQTHIEVARAALAVARESLRPGWSLNASYGHRQRDQGGNDRSDFVSLGVTVDLPLFRDNRQLKTIEAAASRVEAADSERRLKLNQLQALEREALATHQRLAEQARLYTDTLLPQYVTLTQAALNAYASDQADFADVMRAHIAQLNARVDLVRVESEQAKANAQLKYVRTR